MKPMGHCNNFYKSVKLVVTDLDKTVLTDELGITDKTAEAFHGLHKNGMLICVATTRPRRSTKQYEQLLFTDYVISCGGSVLEKRDEIIWHSPLMAKTASQIIKQAKKLDVGRISIVTRGDVLWNSNGKHPDYCSAEHISFDGDIVEDVYKLIIEFENKDIADAIAESVGCITTKYSNTEWVRFSNPNATKEDAVKQLMKYLGLSPDNVLCFGDDYSDIGMFREFMGVSVSNAIEPIRTLAKYSTKSNSENGVAEFITKFLTRRAKDESCG